MTRLYQFLLLYPIAAVLTMPVLAQSTAPQSGSATLSVKDVEREKSDLYNSFLATYKTANDQARAYKTACDYLQKFPEDDSPQALFLKRFVYLYEKAMRQFHVGRLVEEGNFSEAFSFGREMLKSDPNDFVTLYTLVQGGVLAFTNGQKSYRFEAVDYASRALRMLESDSTIDQRQEKVGLLYVSLGVFNFLSDPDSAATYFSKFSALENVKNDPRMYARLADAIMGAEFFPLQREFNSRFPTPEQRMSADAQATRHRLYLVVDFIIDALARAVALAGSEPRFQQLSADWMERLVKFYKFRNSGYITGLADLVQGILNEPFPRAPHY
ncbi:MAG TPA: hypothetical protein VGW58_17475 [Pyrinomonadaceae bacterium]|nr:hypothetical protein [Pyrinomonadaceae bacterium]